MYPMLLYFPYIENLTVSTQGAMAQDSLFRSGRHRVGCSSCCGPQRCL